MNLQLLLLIGTVGLVVVAQREEVNDGDDGDGDGGGADIGDVKDDGDGDGGHIIGDGGLMGMTMVMVVVVMAMMPIYW